MKMKSIEVRTVMTWAVQSDSREKNRHLSRKSQKLLQEGNAPRGAHLKQKAARTRKTDGEQKLFKFK